MVYDVTTYLDKHPRGEEIQKNVQPKMLQNNSQNIIIQTIHNLYLNIDWQENQQMNHHLIIMLNYLNKENQEQEQIQIQIKNPYKKVTWEELECHRQTTLGLLQIMMFNIMEE
ncbi:unnamed protein product [Paramecium sonneborni]|uniref:Cytochrome b5 heme-binding domain-containing protein n=1 Tax=Paramecium sonneborni TaxID=65129 RepID=A0A8S1RHV7_9CILI|nr:unnamed protein product [Paramecium sonneborni]